MLTRDPHTVDPQRPGKPVPIRSRRMGFRRGRTPAPLGKSGPVATRRTATGTTRPGFTPAPVKLRTRGPLGPTKEPTIESPLRSAAVRRLAVTVFIAALAIVVISSTRSSAAFTTATAQVQTWTTEVAARADQVWDRHVQLGAVIEAHRNLRTDHTAVRLELMRLQEVEREHARLTDVFQMSQPLHLSGVVGRVVGRPTTGRQTLRLDVGSERGLHAGLPVLSADGLVGQVVDSGPEWADVLLISDPTHAVPAIVDIADVHGTGRGTGHAVRLDHVIGGTSLAVGSNVLTSGEGGVFPRGIPIGVVTGVARDTGPFLDVTVEIAAPAATVSEVLVLTVGTEEVAQR